MNGFRQPQAASKKDQIREIKTQVTNLEMSSRITQMMVQRLLENNKAMGDDLNRSLNIVSELQYKILAMQKVGSFDDKQMAAVANDLRLVDFNDAAAKEDAKEGLLAGDVVLESSIITITSIATGADGKDNSIFRSRIKLADTGVPDLITSLLGQKVGVKVTVKLNEVDHEIELLDIKNPAVPAEAPVSSNDAVVGNA